MQLIRKHDLPGPRAELTGPGLAVWPSGAELRTLPGRHAWCRTALATPGGKAGIASGIRARAPGPGSAGRRTARAAPGGGACGYLHTRARLAGRATQIPPLSADPGKGRGRGAEESPCRHAPEWLAVHRRPRPILETGRAQNSGGRPRAESKPPFCLLPRAVTARGAPSPRPPVVIRWSRSMSPVPEPPQALPPGTKLCRNCGRSRWRGRAGLCGRAEPVARVPRRVGNSPSQRSLATSFSPVYWENQVVLFLLTYFFL